LPGTGAACTDTAPLQEIAKTMQIRRATRSDCADVAGLALIAGEGIPAYFWALDAGAGVSIEAQGALNAASETGNFSYRNAWLMVVDGRVAGMLLAYRLPAADAAEDLQALPEFIRPLVELEQCVPGSFYINMLATYPDYRNRGIGSRLMGRVDELAADAGCDLTSIEVFEENAGALRLYQRLGYRIVERRAVVPHECHPYHGDIVLLTRPVAGRAAD
jgi:ribosomal protein S18 acetylase RimI-like enzyme